MTVTTLFLQCCTMCFLISVLYLALICLAQPHSPKLLLSQFLELRPHSPAQGFPTHTAFSISVGAVEAGQACPPSHILYSLIKPSARLLLSTYPQSPAQGLFHGLLAQSVTTMFILATSLASALVKTAEPSTVDQSQHRIILYIN